MPPQAKLFYALNDLAAEFGRDPRYLSGCIDGMRLQTFRGAKNAKTIDQAGYDRLAARLRETPVEACKP